MRTDQRALFWDAMCAQRKEPHGREHACVVTSQSATDAAIQVEHHRRAELHGAFGNDAFGKLAERAARFFGTPQYIVGQTVAVLAWVVVKLEPVASRVRVGRLPLHRFEPLVLTPGCLCGTVNPPRPDASGGPRQTSFGANRQDPRPHGACGQGGNGQAARAAAIEYRPHRAGQERHGAGRGPHETDPRAPHPGAGALAGRITLSRG